MNVSILCGESPVELNLPDNTAVLEPRPAPALDNPEQAVIDALANPIESAPLAELAKGKKSACVVISDITRPVPNALILKPMLKILEDAGIMRDKITILNATGMHRPNFGEEMERMVGEYIMKNYNIVNHYCREEDDVRQVAEIDGAPIEINKIYLDADLKILTGLIEPHMYAGYSGGRKSILPGISSYKTMQFMHSFKMIDQPGVTNCKLDGNPFHEAGEKVMAAVGADFLVNVIINKQREMTGLFAGHPTTAHQEGCKEVREHAVFDLEDKADLIITSAGGYPLDATFYQVSKGLIMARGMVKPTGKIVILCECREGLGSPEYCELIREGRDAKGFFEHAAKPENFVIDQWCLQTTYQAVDFADEIYVYSPNLSAADLEPMGFKKIDDVQTIVDQLLPSAGKVVAVPQGPYVVGLTKES